MASINYLIPQQTDSDWGIVATTVGIYDHAARVPYPCGDHPSRYIFDPRRGRVFDEYQIIHIVRGRGWFESAHCKRTEIREGDFLLLFPGEWHSYAPAPETGWTEAWIGFSGLGADHLLKHRFFTPEMPVFHLGVQDLPWELFRRACDVAQNQPPAYQQLLAGYVNLILSMVYAHSRRPENLDDDILNRLNQAKQYMTEHAREVLAMEDVAQAVGMGYSKFRKEFRNYTGFAPGNYFIRLKLAQSKELLLMSNRSCKEIAFEMGFDTATYFSQLFHRYYGVTPNKFRRRVEMNPPRPEEREETSEE